MLSLTWGAARNGSERSNVKPARKEPALRLSEFDAAVFDLDGVVTATARVHAAAWKELFDGFLTARATATGEPLRPFDAGEDYLRYVDGKPRYEGVRSFLKSRGIKLPYGRPDDPPERDTICGLGNRKDRLFNALLATGGLDVFEDSVAFIKTLRTHSLRTALVSSSKNAATVLKTAGLTDLFDVRVDGVEAERLGLKGKPDPDIFLHAVRSLGVAPARAFGVEDALAGVEAIRAAGFGLAIGTDRRGQAAELRRHGADVVVEGLAHLRLAVDDRTVRNGASNPLRRWHEFAARLEGRQLAVFLDYDGTLTPIVARPDLAVLSEGTRGVVRDLSELCPVAVVSGRDRADVERLVGLDGVIYAGSHGFDISGPRGLRKEHEEAAGFLPALDGAERELRGAMAGVNGALVERKRFAIAAHYRLVSESEVKLVEAAVDAALAGHQRLRKTYGKKVFELRPRLAWDKGKAVLWLLSALGLDRPEVLPLYLGDDDTDEDAFHAIAGRGLGILVANEPQPTAASYRVDDPEAARVLLGLLVDWLRFRDPSA